MKTLKLNLNLKKSLIYLLLSLLLVSWSISTTLAQTSEPVTPTEEIAATEETTVTPEVIPGDTVTVIIEDTPTPAPTDEDWLNIRQIVELVGLIVVIAVGIFRGGSILEGAAKLFGRVSSNPLITETAMQQYQRLSPGQQAKIATLIDVIDPLTKTTAADLDDNIVLWLRKITVAAIPPIDDDLPGVG